MHRPRPLLITLALAGLMGSPAQAAIYTVGDGAGCTHGTIQSAISAANSSPGADTVRLTRSLTYESEANTINTAQVLTVEGGYATCDQATPDNIKTVVSGAGGAHAPVFTINAPTGALIHLRKLKLSGGDVDGGSTGGGIRYEGDGILDLADLDITQNIAGYGGGIYAKGTHSNAELVIGPNVLIIGNTARYDGGGIYSSELELTMTAPGSVLMNNLARGDYISGAETGHGGGLYIHASNRHSYAYVGSGLAGLGAIYGNRALYGGGVALGGKSSNDDDHTNAELHLFTTDPAHPARIAGNSATIAGGAFHAKSFHGTFDGWMNATVRVWNASIEDNFAPDGAVAFLKGDEPTIGYPTYAGIEFNPTPPPAGALPCALGIECGRISGNDTMDQAGNLTDGALFRGATSVFVGIGRASATAPLPQGGTLITDNRSGRLFWDGGDPGYFQADDTLIAGNQFSKEVVRTSDRMLTFTDSTLAGNTIGAGRAFVSFDADVQIKRSILWQPGVALLERSGGTMAVDHVMASEIDSLGGNFGGGGDCGGGACAIRANPLFIDPAHGDYRLRAGSPAIDMAPPITGDDRDAHGQPRDQDLPYTWSDNGVRDLGAFERQHVQPLVLNQDFDLDLRLWDMGLAGTATRDATQNASGAASSGSVHVTRAGPANGEETRGLSQCIHLPGPATYALNGWGRGTGSNVVIGDKARLRWEYRRNGGDDCNNGAPDAFGWHDLTGSTTWRRPAQPAFIEIAPADWGATPSIKVILTAVETPAALGATNAWFDGITLEVQADDVIFADDFD